MSIPVPSELIPLLTQLPFVAVLIWFVLHRDAKNAEMQREQRKEFQQERELWRKTIKDIEATFRESIESAETRWREEIRHMNDRFIEHSSSNREVLNRALDSIEKLTSPAELAGAISRRLDDPNRDRGRRRGDE